MLDESCRLELRFQIPKEYLSLVAVVAIVDGAKTTLNQHFIVFVPGNPEKTSVARDSPFNTVATS